MTPKPIKKKRPKSCCHCGRVFTKKPEVTIESSKVLALVCSGCGLKNLYLAGG